MGRSYAQHNRDSQGPEEAVVPYGKYYRSYARKEALGQSNTPGVINPEFQLIHIA